MNDKHDRHDETSDPKESTGSASDVNAAPPPSDPPPRGPRVRTVVGITLVVLVVFWIGGAVGDRVANGLSSVWHSMFGGDESDDGGDGSFYTCGMHPWVILPKKGICPICQMDLTPIDPAKFTGEVAIDPRVVQSIGVRIEEVKTGPLVRTIRTVGSVDYDETAVRDVNIKVNGWIEKLYVDYLGAEVKEGEPLFDIFSRELYDTQWQYLIALRSRGGKEVPFVPGSARDTSNLLESSRIRLEYYDVSAEQIADLEKNGKPGKTMTIRSPHTGVVISKHANKGMLVDPGMLVYRIADLSKVWVLVTLYEYQIPFVSEGQKAVMSLPYIPGQTLEGEVIYIYPYLQKETREVQIRLEFDNPGGLLKPGMFANVELKNTLARERVLAPRAAVIDTGERQVAFVSLGDGKFEPREVRMGIETEGGRVEILDGLNPGDMVVTSGQFLLDSESKIREALGKMIKGNLASEQKAVAALAGVSELKTLPAETEKALLSVLGAYGAIADKLAGDKIDGIADPAREIAAAIQTMIGTKIPEDEHFWHRHTEAAIVRGKALEITSEKEISIAREKFADLSVALGKLVRATGVPPSYGKEVQELRCPMYREGQGGGLWLQGAGDVRNPFYGSMMLRCFDQRVALPVTGGGAAKTPSPKKPELDHTGHGEKQPPVEEPTSTKAKEPEKAPSSETTPKPDHSEHAATKDDPDTASRTPVGRQLDELVDAYLTLSEMLAKDSVAGAAKHLTALRGAANALVSRDDATPPLRQLAGAVANALPADSAAGDLKAFRQSFKAVSKSVIALVGDSPPSRAVAPSLFEAYCPHAKASWLQTTKTIANPFYGSSMLRCGSVTRTHEPREKE